MSISITRSLSSRPALPSVQAKTQKGAFDFSKFGNQALNKLLDDIKNNSDFRENLNKDEIFRSVQDEFDRMDENYKNDRSMGDVNATVERTLEKVNAIIDRKVTLAGIRDEVDPKPHWTSDFLGKAQEVGPLEMLAGFKPILLDVYI